MAAITHVFTIARVAHLLGEDEDWLREISIEMEPEDGVIVVYGPGDDDFTPAFTDLGIENLRELIEIYRDSQPRSSVAATETDPVP
ncbi:hypothetical protein [Shumkonia mesophila]|uniref:hypothetical protein n=1 Tax=Shumkonia mesophila TaxID=2838854 RepID=UPI0029342A77|nr:hypothetical protein [Shumkonia mesophila]